MCIWTFSWSRVRVSVLTICTFSIDGGWRGGQCGAVPRKLRIQYGKTPYASVSPEWHLVKEHVFILTFFRRLCGSGCGGIFLDKTLAALSTRGMVWAAA